MAIMAGSLYDALKSANVDDDKARKAAEEVASYEGRLGSLDGRLNLLHWMVGVNIALTITVLFKVFS